MLINVNKVNYFFVFSLKIEKGNKTIPLFYKAK